MATALQQMFGILTAVDCTDDLWMIGLIMLMIGLVLGAVFYYVIEKWK